MTSKKDVQECDVVVVGAGVVGIAVARRLALYTDIRKIILLEARSVPLSGASSGNSAMIHCGFDCTPNTTESAMVKRGHTLFSQWYETKSSAAKIGRNGAFPIPHRKNGAVMLARNKEEYDGLQGCARQALDNGVTSCKILENAKEVQAIEPCVNAEGLLGGLHVPDEWSVDPWVIPSLYLAEALKAGNVKLFTKYNVTQAQWDAQTKRWTLGTSGNGTVSARCVVNCAGLQGDRVAALLRNATATAKNNRGPSSATTPDFQIFPRLGRFVVFPGAAAKVPLNGALLPLPTKKTKGIIIFRSVHGDIVVGPTAEDPDEVRESQDAINKKLIDIAYDRLPMLKEIHQSAGGGALEVFAGQRPAVRNRSDYVLHHDKEFCLLTVGGVRSTGLTSSLALGEWVASALAASPSPTVGKGFCNHVSEPKSDDWVNAWFDVASARPVHALSRFPALTAKL